MARADDLLLLALERATTASAGGGGATALVRELCTLVPRVFLDLCLDDSVFRCWTYKNHLFGFDGDRGSRSRRRSGSRRGESLYNDNFRDRDRGRDRGRDRRWGRSRSR